MQQEAIDVAQEAMNKFNIEKDIAMHIKKTVRRTRSIQIISSDQIPVRHEKGADLALYSRA
jgi:hypothetical protein